ncbi:MAG: STAS domain-containing protein [Oscillospiraceae bacterium]|nr:STAS domain-containing protein [Oscillospiraceae bacterium]
MTIKKTTDGNTAVLEIDGWLDTQTAPELGAELDALDKSVTELTIDMSALEYISSAGLRQIVAAHKKMNGNLTIKNISAEIMDVFNMTGFSKRLNIV